MKCADSDSLSLFLTKADFMMERTPDTTGNPMTKPLQLAEDACWRVAGLRDAEVFFRAVARFLPEATEMFLEGSPDPDVAILLSRHRAQVEYGAPIGTILSWPQRNRRFALRTSPGLFDELSEIAPHHAEPEICSHLHFYRDREPLAHWFDAFYEPLLVSKSIPRGRMEEFVRAAGGTLADTPG